jgi:hypothetical protein
VECIEAVRMIVPSDEVGRALHTTLWFGEPLRRASCGPHATEEQGVVPPRWCCVLLHAPRRLKTECLLKEHIDEGLDDEDLFFLKKRLVVLFHMVYVLFVKSIFGLLN